MFSACPDLRPSTLNLPVPTYTDAPLALPAQPEPPSAVLVRTCDNAGRSVARGAKRRARGLHEDQPRRDGAGKGRGSGIQAGVTQVQPPGVWVQLMAHEFKVTLKSSLDHHVLHRKLFIFCSISHLIQHCPIGIYRTGIGLQ